MFRWFEHSQVYQPDRVLAASGAELGRPFEDVFFKTSDGVTLNGWFFPAAFNSTRREFAMLVCHGNAGNISTRLELCAALLQTGVNVFVFDYRGYGRSEGRPGEEGTYCDGQAAHRWLVQKGFVGENIIVFGESLGGGIASELAVRETCGGIVLENTFSCLADLGAELFPWLPVRWIATMKYETCARLPRLKIPVMVMHSRGDQLIRFHHGEKNYQLANQPKFFWELKGGHADAVFEDRENFIQGIEKFLEMVSQAQGCKKPEAGKSQTSNPKSQ